MASKPYKAALALSVLVVLALGFGFVLSEVAYRVYLYRYVRERFVPPKVESYFSLYDRSLWRYSERFGYEYPPDRGVAYTGVMDGKVRDCYELDPVNGQGNIGASSRDYDSAQVKILIFGASWNVFSLNHTTWPMLLQARLEQRLGKTVSVVNFGRDGFGLLQMVSLAAEEVPKWKPDVAIISFLTDNLDARRTWRTEVTVDGIPRVLTTVEPTPNPDPARSVDTFLLHEKASLEWCRSMQGRDRPDSVLREILARHRMFRVDPMRVRADLYATDRSYLLDRAMHGDPFRSVLAGFKIPRLEIRDYAEDRLFMADWTMLAASGVAVVPIHLAYYPELKDGVEYLTTFNQSDLLQSFERLLGRKALRTTDYTPLPLENPERLNAADNDFHPSPWAMEFYADVVAEMLIRNGYVK